ncbi:MAG: hypothetical protein EP330_21215 [Deltaproteobacteria bacterium]|nr:MAG: hypothetical protein EP330_21215 [Deltaproteobacteria bacterium]
MLLSLLLAMASASTIAVAPFQVASRDDALSPLGVGLADMVLTDLCVGASITCVERHRVSELLAEIELGTKGYLDPRTAAQMGKGLGAEQVVFGTLSSAGDDLRLDARLVDVSSGKVLVTAKARGPKADVFDLEVQLVESLAAPLTAEPPPREPVSTEAVEVYGKALQAEDKGNAELARALLDAAVLADPKMVWAAERLRALDAKLTTATAARVETLGTSLVATVERIADGDTAACRQLQADLWSLSQPLTMGGRFMSLDPAFALESWRQAGLTAQPADLQELADGVGRQLYEVYAITRVVLDHGFADDLCPGANPNEVVLGNAIIVLGFVREGAGKPVEIRMIDGQGAVVREPEELDDLLLSLVDSYVMRFPAGPQMSMIPTWVDPAAARVAAREPTDPAQ